MSPPWAAIGADWFSTGAPVVSCGVSVDIVVATVIMGITSLARVALGMAVGIGVAVSNCRPPYDGDVGSGVFAATVGVYTEALVAETAVSSVGATCPGGDGVTASSSSRATVGLALLAAVTVRGVGRVDVDVGLGSFTQVGVVVGLRVDVGVAVGAEVVVGRGVSVRVGVDVGGGIGAVDVDVDEGVAVGSGDAVHVAVAVGVSVAGGAQI